MDTTDTTRTITLTGRPPVRVSDAAWPQIASGADSWHDGAVECQANRRRACWIRVRQRADGRAIVYARSSESSQFRGEEGHDLRGGVLLAPGDDVAAAIHAVAADLLARGGWDRLAEVAHECVADLPAETLDGAAEVRS